MSKAEYWQRGETLDFVNSTGKVIEANTIIVLGQRMGVAGYAPEAAGENDATVLVKING